jgi:hypothetical protein
MAVGEENGDYFREKASQCRRLAADIVNQRDPAVAALLAMATEFEDQAGRNRCERSSPASCSIITCGPDRGPGAAGPTSPPHSRRSLTRPLRSCGKTHRK